MALSSAIAGCSIGLSRGARLLGVACGVLLALAVAGPGHAQQQAPGPLLDIEQYGARSLDVDPTFDNGPILNWLLQHVGRDLHGTIYIPPKAYGIRSTVQTPQRMSIALVGAGGVTLPYSEAHYQGGNLGGPASRLVWTAQEPGVMLRIRSWGVYLHGITLVGRYQPTHGNYRNEKAAVGILVETQQAGIGTGKIYAPLLSICDCRTGIQFGEERPQADNADNAVFGFLTCAGCETGYLVRNEQSVGHVIQHYRPYATKVGFRFERGGKLHVESVDQVSGGSTLLSLGKPGQNEATYRFKSVTIDNGVVRDSPDGSWRLFENDSYYPANVVFNGLHLPSVAYEGPVAILKGAMSLTIRDGFNLRSGLVRCEPQAVQWGGETGVVMSPIVRVESSRFQSGTPAELVEPSSGRHTISWTNCFSNTGEAFDDGKSGGQ